MLRIEPHIAVADIAVGGGDMGLFIKSSRFLSGHENGKDAIKSEEPKQYPPGVLLYEVHRVVVRIKIIF